jgi:hypothetical protein
MNASLTVRPITPDGDPVMLGTSRSDRLKSVSVFVIPDDERNPAPGSASPASAISVGSSDVLSDGTIRMRADIPQQTDVGAYVLQISGYTPALQIRTINVGMNVTLSTTVLRTTMVITSAFFKGRSDKFTRAGIRKQRQAVASVPVGSKDIRLNVMAVSVSEPTVQADRRIATKRARALVSFLKARGVPAVHGGTSPLDGFPYLRDAAGCWLTVLLGDSTSEELHELGLPSVTQ